MTDATLLPVSVDDQSTPRRTIRIPDDEWNAAQQRAQANGENISVVTRRRLADYAEGDMTTQYRAVSRTISTLVVDNITGDLDDVRAHFPAKHWNLESREVATYRPMGRRSV